MSLDLFTGTLLLFKVGFLIIVFMVSVFILVVLNQIRSMNTIVTQPDMFPYLEAFVFFLLGCTIVLFIAALVIL